MRAGPSCQSTLLAVPGLVVMAPRDDSKDREGPDPEPVMRISANEYGSSAPQSRQQT